MIVLSSVMTTLVLFVLYELLCECGVPTLSVAITIHVQLPLDHIKSSGICGVGFDTEVYISEFVLHMEGKLIEKAAHVSKFVRNIFDEICIFAVPSSLNISLLTKLFAVS